LHRLTGIITRQKFEERGRRFSAIGAALSQLVCDSVAPALVVGAESRRHPRSVLIVRHVASRAGSAGTAAIARARALPRPIEMIFADPSAAVAALANHANRSAPAWVSFT
jgi:hypothetical protein